MLGASSCMRRCMYVHTHRHVCMCLCMYAQTSTHKLVCACTDVPNTSSFFLSPHMCMHMYMRTYTHTYVWRRIARGGIGHRHRVVVGAARHPAPVQLAQRCVSCLCFCFPTCTDKSHPPGLCTAGRRGSGWHRRSNMFCSLLFGRTCANAEPRGHRKRIQLKTCRSCMFIISRC